MSYGDYDGPDKDDKGREGGSCNRTRCQAAPANWFNHGSHSWYCADCRKELERANKRDWDNNLREMLGYPMFETREMIEARKAKNSG